MASLSGLMWLPCPPALVELPATGGLVEPCPAFEDMAKVEGGESGDLVSKVRLGDVEQRKRVLEVGACDERWSIESIGKFRRRLPNEIEFTHIPGLFLSVRSLCGYDAWFHNQSADWVT
jgi:hypothetical protein